jgi:hypothetical protein
MAVFSLFHSLVTSACPASVDDPIADELMEQLQVKERYNVLFYKADDLEMDADDTRVISLANYSVSYPNDQVIVVLWVDGWVELQTVAKDYDNATTINGYQRAYGNSVFPGVLILSTYNATSFTLKALQANTKIRYLVAVACADGDARYTDYA